MTLRDKVIELLENSLWYPEKHVDEVDTRVAQKLNLILVDIIKRIKEL